MTCFSQSQSSPLHNVVFQPCLARAADSGQDVEASTEQRLRVVAGACGSMFDVHYCGSAEGFDTAGNVAKAWRVACPVLYRLVRAGGGSLHLSDLGPEKRKMDAVERIVRARQRSSPVSRWRGSDTIQYSTAAVALSC